MDAADWLILLGIFHQVGFYSPPGWVWPVLWIVVILRILAGLVGEK